jgi:hypothetical protein
MYHLILVSLLLMGLPVSVYSQQRTIVSLDEAISGAVRYLLQNNAMPKDSGIAFAGFTVPAKAPTKALSDNILRGLRNGCLGHFKIVEIESQYLDLLRQEIDLADSEAVRIPSQQRYGQWEGVHFFIDGSIALEGDVYVLQIRVLRTEGRVWVGEFSAYVSKNDNRIKSFLPKSTGEKIGTGALNMVFGLGSYIEGDTMGGITLTAGYALAAGLFIIEATALDWDSPAVGVPATLGLTSAILTTVYGFARPFIYHYSPRTVAVMDNIRTGIVPVSDTYGNRNAGFTIAYTFKF